MARARKRHVQQAIRFPDKNGQWRGGARRGAGRKKRGKFASERHLKRPRLSGREPVLVTVRVVRGAGNLRRGTIYHCVRRAMQTTWRRSNFRIVHLSIQGTHLHLLVEAADHQALSRGMQGFLISAAQRINRAVSKRTGEHRRGSVFPDRYHERVITSPRQCRNAICYVLNNWRKHGEDRSGAAREWLVDPFSSAAGFAGWRELGAERRFEPPGWYEPLPAREAKTWLLRAAWKRHGLLGVREVPGPGRALVSVS